MNSTCYQVPPIIARLAVCLMIVACMQLPGYAQSPIACNAGHQEIVDRDGANARITIDCNKDGMPVIEISRTNANASKPPAKMQLLVVSEDEEPIDGVNFVDLDNDGLHEVEVRGSCGAGPNCFGDLYRFDPSSGKWYLFFSGGWYDISIIDGYLVEAGRASCCAWEFHAYRMPTEKRSLSYENMSMRITVEATGDAEGNSDEILCTFYDQKKEKVIAPPNDRWLKSCSHYGPTFKLATADTDNK